MVATAGDGYWFHALAVSFLKGSCGKQEAGLGGPLTQSNRELLMFLNMAGSLNGDFSA